MCNLDVILNPTIYTYSPKYKQLKFVSNYRCLLAMCITDYNLWSFVLSLFCRIALKRSKTSICKWLKAVHWIRQRILNLVSKIFHKLTNEIVLIKQQQQINKQDFFWFVKEFTNNWEIKFGIRFRIRKSHQIQCNKLFDQWSFEIS